MFHVELRQFPNVARAFNLSGEELQARILGPWMGGRAVELNDRRWSPEKARLTIYEGPELRTEEMGLGRGWANVTRTGEDVTQPVLAAAHVADSAVDQVKHELVARCTEAPLPITEVLALASAGRAGSRASDRLALAEDAVWQLLHQGQVRLVRGGEPVAAEEWEAVLLAWETWAGGEGIGLILTALVLPGDAGGT